MDGHGEHSKPVIGDLTKDMAKNKVGILVGTVGGRYLMRPASGGLGIITRTWRT
ncbi:hypothetical protein [Streptomyces sp. SID2888]|uniref:hypothetical protein n=1 Tax=Streptomyces sp. SID2888 TaxID=2690256 RepID=UPI00136DC163|nr:hypothetical protein [Streptomyces sp. SID2888]MYV47418.1 hypothetical protein [Streptomyces sp. SID2888]